MLIERRALELRVAQDIEVARRGGSGTHVDVKDLGLVEVEKFGLTVPLMQMICLYRWLEGLSQYTERQRKTTFPYRKTTFSVF